jgi:hypothetical protein
MTVKRFLVNRSVVKIVRPPHSPDLAPADFFYSLAVTGKFQDAEDIMKNVIAE